MHFFNDLIVISIFQECSCLRQDCALYCKECLSSRRESEDPIECDFRSSLAWSEIISKCDMTGVPFWHNRMAPDEGMTISRPPSYD